MVLDDGLPTATSHDQAELERRVLQIYATAYADGGRGAGSPTRCRPVAAAAAATVRALQQAETESLHSTASYIAACPCRRV